MARAIRAGRLRFRVDIQRVTQVVDSVGQPGETWGTLDTVWADVVSYQTSANGREFNRADATYADCSHIVTMRYFSGLTPKDRLQLVARVFEIQSVDNTDERNRETIVYCREKV